MATLFSLALFCSIKEKKVGGIYLEQYISSVFHHIGFFPYEDFAVFKYEAICGTEIYLLLSLVWELLVYIWCAKTLQLCPTLCNPMDCSLLGSCVHGIPQARILEWVTIPFSRGSSQPRDQTQVSYVFCIGRQVLYHLSLIKVNRSLWKWGSWICTFSQISRWFFFFSPKSQMGDFPGSSVVRTPCLHCRGPEFHLWSGNQDPKWQEAQPETFKRGEGADQEIRMTAKNCCSNKNGASYCSIKFT